jgi:hypothetical protein
MAPSAKLFRHASVQVESYFSSRFSGFRRTTSTDQSRVQDLRVISPNGNYSDGLGDKTKKPLFSSGKPFSQTDTIDRMLIQMEVMEVATESRMNLAA